MFTGIMTVIALITFIGIVWWAFSRGRAKANRDSAMLPFAQPDEVDLVAKKEAEGDGKRDEQDKKQGDPNE